jgi:hypothetical protein
MSAAAGISSAKKRRGVVPTGPETTPTSKQLQSQGQGQGQGINAGMVTPIQILQNHEIRLKIIERNLSELEEQPVTTVKQTSTTATTPSTTSVADSKLLQEYKTKCDTLEKKVEELSHLVQKVQTFSMESNLAFLKLKRVFDEDFENRIRELKQSYISEENMIQAVKFETANALSSMSAFSEPALSE